MADLQYRRIYKYALDEDFSCQTRMRGFDVKIPPVNDRDPWIHLVYDGTIHIRAGYSWDGPSGPAFDSKNFMRASLVHDALYQLMEEGFLPKKMRKKADQTMRDIAKLDGMGGFRRFYTYWAVRFFGGSHI